MVTVRLTGAYGRGGASGSMPLSRDEWWEVALYAGQRDAPGSTLCTGGLTMGIPGTRVGVPPDHDAAVAWIVGTRLVEFQGDTATVDLRWRRDPRAGGLEPQTAYETQVRWKVNEGAQTVLDTVHAPASSEGTCASTAVTAEFGIGSASEFRNAAIAYDVWLVQQMPDGDTRTHHLRTTGAQGAAATMMFPLVPLDEIAPGVPPLDLKVHGEIRGRLRLDGTVDVSVDAARYVIARDASMGTGGSGRSHLRLGLGETVEFRPVPLSGMLHGHQLEDLLATAPTAIRVRATRLW